MAWALPQMAHFLRVEVVIGHLLEDWVLGRLLLEHLEPSLLECRQVLVAPALDLHLVLVAHRTLPRNRPLIVGIQVGNLKQGMYVAAETIASGATRRALNRLI